MDKETYTTTEVALLLGVSQKTVIRWCKAGRFPGAYLYLQSPRLGYRIPKDIPDILAGGGTWLGPGELQLPLALASERAG